MTTHPIQCSYCKKTFFRSTQRINEAKKFFWKPYCSLLCLTKAKNKQITLTCANCSKEFTRQPSKLAKSSIYYCSRSCAAIANNTKFPKHPGIKKQCLVCKKTFINKEKYCSLNCKVVGQTIPREVILEKIQNFYIQKNRIPLKREFIHAVAARRMFGSWNKAIKAAGLEPNPVLFARKCIANDGHKCDSLAEKIIDDWLYKKKISHERTIPYHQNNMTADFKINNILIEFFGLSGQLKSYDRLIKEKERLWKKRSLKVIKIYPKDLFPKNNLDQILKF